MNKTLQNNFYYIITFCCCILVIVFLLKENTTETIIISPMETIKPKMINNDIKVEYIRSNKIIVNEDTKNITNFNVQKKETNAYEQKLQDKIIKNDLTFYLASLHKNKHIVESICMEEYSNLKTLCIMEAIDKEKKYQFYIDEFLIYLIKNDTSFVSYIHNQITNLNDLFKKSNNQSLNELISLYQMIVNNKSIPQLKEPIVLKIINDYNNVSPQNNKILFILAMYKDFYSIKSKIRNIEDYLLTKEIINVKNDIYLNIFYNEILLKHKEKIEEQIGE